MFGRGKFDLYKRNVSVLLQALGQLITQILTQDDLPVSFLFSFMTIPLLSIDLYKMWQKKIRAALGQEAQVVIDVMPHLQKVIGPQPAVATLPPADTARRLNSRILALVQLFSTADHPLVLFVDDLQWADAMSLNLLQVLFDQPHAHLLLIGAYRDNEVDEGHPLMRLLANIKESNSKAARCNTITLQPLQLADILALTKDTLRCGEVEAHDLAVLLQLKARGNPFFINQILQAFHSDGLITFNYQKGSWVYDIEKLKFTKLSDDVVDLLCYQIDKMSAACSRLIQVASCVGNRFSLHELAVAADGTTHEVAALLWSIIQTGLILPVDQCYSLYVLAHERELGINSGYKPITDHQAIPMGNSVYFRFLHDRCQQAAYRIIPEDQRASMRLRIGRSMLQHTPEDEVSAIVTDIVEHFNAGYLLMEDTEEIKQVIKLNISAATKAKISTAYEASVKYTSAALSMLEMMQTRQNISYWDLDYDLSVSVYLLFSDCYYLHGQFTEAEKSITEALLKVKAEDDMKKSQFLHIRQFIYIAQSRYIEALAVGVDAMTSLGFALPGQEEIDRVMQSEEKLMETIDRSVAQPPMEDPRALQIMALLITTFSPAYFMVHPLFSPIMIAMLLHSLEYGKSVMSCFMLSCFTHVMHEYQYMTACYKVGKLAKKLVEEYGAEARAYRCKVFSSFSVAVAHWAYAMVDCMPEIRRASLMCLEEGDHEYFSYTSFFLLDLTLYAGRHPLEVVASRQKDVLEAFRKRKLPMAIKYVTIWRICLSKLLGDMAVDQEEFDMDGVMITQQNLLDELLQLQINSFLFACYTAELTFAYFSMQFPRAIKAGEGAINIPAWKRGGLVVVPNFNFYYALALLADIPNVYLSSTTPSRASHPTSLEDVLLQSAMRVASSSLQPEPSPHEESLNVVQGLQESMLLWSQHAPMNYSHKYQLVEAERVRVFIFHHPEIHVCGPRYDLCYAALRLYDNAILGAKANQFVHEEALANELAGRFCVAIDRKQDSISCIFLPLLFLYLLFSIFFSILIY